MDYSSPHIEKSASELKEAIAQGKVDVPVLPEVAQKVMALAQDPESDAPQLAAIIQTDPTMGGHVMRIANSAAYTPSSNLVSIQQAIARLGMVEISNIALSTSINSKMFNAPGYDTHIAMIWKHALATALWSKEVARMMRSNVEAAFLCGLLHSIGRPVILQTIADTSGQETLLSHEALDELYKLFESAYAKAVANEWGLPTLVAEAIGFYKHFSDAPSASELAATIAFGNQLANLMLYPDTTNKDLILNSSALALINLYPDEINTLIDKQPDIKTGMDTLSLP